MATANQPDTRTEPCKVCGQPNTRPVMTWIGACPRCIRDLLCIVNDIPTEISEPVRRAVNV